jgi:O-antigen/teichoic acid export membrane protein
MLTSRSIVSRPIFLLTAKLIPVLVLLAVTIIYSRALPYEQYGLFQSVWMYNNIINIFLTFGLTSIILSEDAHSLVQFIHRHSRKISFFYLSVFAITGLSFYFFGKGYSNPLRLLLLLFFVVQTLAGIAETFLIKQGRERMAVAINTVYSLLFFGWHLFILNHEFSIARLVTGILVIASVKLVVSFSVAHFSKATSIPQKEDKAFTKHWLFLGVNDIAGVVSKWMDKLFLLYLLSPADFAIFFNGSFEIPLFGLLVSVAGSLLLLEISSDPGNKRRSVATFRSTYTILSVIVFPLFCFLLFQNKELFRLLFGGKYDASLPVFVVSIFLLPARINNYGALLQCYGKGAIIFKGSILDISCGLILMLILYPLWGTVGVAIAMVLATYLQIAYYIWQSAKLLRVGVGQLLPSVQSFVFLALCAGLFFLANTILSPSNIYTGLIPGGILTLVMILCGSAYVYRQKIIKQNI